MKKTFGIIMWGIVLLIVAAVVYEGYKNPDMLKLATTGFNKKQDLTKDEAYLLMAEDTLKEKNKLPFRIDEYTTEVDVELFKEPYHRVYTNTINKLTVNGEERGYSFVMDKKADFKKILKPILIKDICSESLKAQFKLGFFEEFVYNYEDGRKVMSFKIGNGDCK